VLTQETGTLTHQIQIWPIDGLVFYARNPRKNDSVVDRKCSCRALGFELARHSELPSVPRAQSL
jgi:hypothetical protein